MKRLFVMASVCVLAILIFAACQPPTSTGGSAATPTTEVIATTPEATPTEEVMATTPEATPTEAMTGTETMTSTEGMTGTSGMTSTEGMTGTGGMTGTTGGAMTGNTVQVSLKEYSIDMETNLAAGMTTFEVTNAGTVEHSFSIEGQGIDQELTTTLQPGEKGTLQVDLQAGDYQAYCPVDDHEGKGMKVTLTVK